MLIVAGPNEDIPTWGVFCILPAAFLAGVAILGVLRPAQAGAMLLASAAVVLLVLVILGAIAGAIDPRWVADQVDAGSTAAGFWFLGAPATVAAVVLLIGGSPDAPLPTPGAGAPNPA